MDIFEIKNLTFSYPETENMLVLDNVNLSIKQGEFITLCGKSGSGKTTLLRHLKTVLSPYGKRSGDILYKGAELKDADLRTQSSEIGYVMQNPDNQIVTDKVWHELAFGLESLGTSQDVMRLRVAEMASYFGIQDWFHRDVADLSGGQKQLLNLASIMAMQPGVIILDEPTSQLDPIAASDFLNTIKKINRELATTIIITEHRLEDILSASDRVIVMDKGQIIADKPPQEIGGYLKSISSDMFGFMPTPIQVYYGLKGEGKCPISVRDGRNRLDDFMKDKEITVTAVEDKKCDLENEDNPALRLKNVWFRYEKDGDDILKGVELKVKSGCMHAILGGNGTGKSTTLKTICNICKPYRGKVKIKGKAIEKYKKEELFKGLLAMLPQNPQSLFVKKTVMDDLKEMLQKKDGTDCLNEIIKECELENILNSHPFDLSGGEQQRVALAKILLTNPEIILLDEPTKGMDSIYKLQFAQILDRLKKKGVTIVMVSHDVEFCAKNADYVSLFFDGQIVTTNTPRSFFSENSFYTTAANRMSRHIFKNAITNEDVIELCRVNS